MPPSSSTDASDSGQTGIIGRYLDIVLGMDAEAKKLTPRDIVLPDCRQWRRKFMENIQQTFLFLSEHPGIDTSFTQKQKEMLTMIQFEITLDRGQELKESFQHLICCHKTSTNAPFQLQRQTWRQLDDSIKRIEIWMSNFHDACTTWRVGIPRLLMVGDPQSESPEPTTTQRDRATQTRSRRRPKRQTRATLSSQPGPLQTTPSSPLGSHQREDCTNEQTNHCGTDALNGGKDFPSEGDVSGGSEEPPGMASIKVTDTGASSKTQEKGKGRELDSPSTEPFVTVVDPDTRLQPLSVSHPDSDTSTKHCELPPPSSRGGSPTASTSKRKLPPPRDDCDQNYGLPNPVTNPTIPRSSIKSPHSMGVEMHSTKKEVQFAPSHTTTYRVLSSSSGNETQGGNGLHTSSRKEAVPQENVARDHVTTDFQAGAKLRTLLKEKGWEFVTFGPFGRKDTDGCDSLYSSVFCLNTATEIDSLRTSVAKHIQKNIGKFRKIDSVSFDIQGLANNIIERQPRPSHALELWTLCEHLRRGLDVSHFTLVLFTPRGRNGYELFISSKKETSYRDVEISPEFLKRSNSATLFFDSFGKYELAIHPELAPAMIPDEGNSMNPCLVNFLLELSQLFNASEIDTTIPNAPL